MTGSVDHSLDYEDHNDLECEADEQGEVGEEVVAEEEAEEEECERVSVIRNEEEEGVGSEDKSECKLAKGHLLSELRDGVRGAVRGSCSSSEVRGLVLEAAEHPAGDLRQGIEGGTGGRDRVNVRVRVWVRLG